MTRLPSLTLYCFPCAGASASVYYSWRRNAPHWLRVAPVELPGRGIRLGEPPARDFDPLVAQLADELVRGDARPFAFFGHSFGALLAYGVTHEFRKRGRELPVALIVAGCSAPTQRDDERLSKLNNDEAIIEELRNLNGTPRALFQHEELLRMTLDVASADFAACRSFVRRDASPLNTDIFVFGGSEDEVKQEGLEAWRLESSRRTEVELFEGGHFFLREQESLFLSTLFEKLESVRASAKQTAILPSGPS